MHRAYERWFDLEQRSGKHLLTECRLPEPRPSRRRDWFPASSGPREHHLKVEQLDASSLRRRCPAFRFNDSVAVLEPQGGYLYVDECVRAHADEAPSAVRNCTSTNRARLASDRERRDCPDR